MVDGTRSQFQNAHNAAEWLRVGFARSESEVDRLRSFPHFVIDPKLGVLASLHSLYDLLAPTEQLNFRAGIRLALEEGVGIDSALARRALLRLAKRYKPSGVRELVERWWRTRAHDIYSGDEKAAEVSAFVDYLCCYEADPNLLQFFTELKLSTDWRPSLASAMLIFALPAAGPEWIDHLRSLKDDFEQLQRQFPKTFNLRNLLCDFCRMAPLLDLKKGLKERAKPDDWMLSDLLVGDGAPLLLTTRMVGEERGIDVLVAICRSANDSIEMGPTGTNQDWSSVRRKFKRSDPSPLEIIHPDVAVGENVVQLEERRRRFERAGRTA